MKDFDKISDALWRHRQKVAYDSAYLPPVAVLHLTFQKAVSASKARWLYKRFISFNARHNDSLIYSLAAVGGKHRTGKPRVHIHAVLFASDINHSDIQPWLHGISQISVYNHSKGIIPYIIRGRARHKHNNGGVFHSHMPFRSCLFTPQKGSDYEKIKYRMEKTIREGFCNGI